MQFPNATAFSSFPAFGGMDYYSPVAYAQDNLNIPDLIYLASSPDSSSSPSIASPRTPCATDLSEPLPAKSAPEESEHVPRPPNSFMVFRSHLAALLKASKVHQINVSCDAGAAWRALTEDEKRPFKLQAAEAKKEHRKKYPGYTYTPGTKAARRSKKPYSRPAKKKSSKRSKANDATTMPLTVPAPAFIQPFEQQIAAPSADMIISAEPMLTNFAVQNHIYNPCAGQSSAESGDWQFGLGLETMCHDMSFMSLPSTADIEHTVSQYYQPELNFDPSVPFDTNFYPSLDVATAPSYSQMDFFNFVDFNGQV